MNNLYPNESFLYETPLSIKIIITLGFFLVARFALDILEGIYTYIFKYRRNLIKRYGQNSWALVTGCTEGKKQ